MDTIQHNPARLYNCDETGITNVQHKHMKIFWLKGKCHISSLQITERGSLVTVITCMSQTGHFIPPLLVFPRKNMKQELMNGKPPGSICLPSLGADTVRDFFPVVSSVHQTYADRRSCYLGTGRALFTHKEPGGHYLERIMLTSFASHLTADTKCNPWINLSRGPWKHSTVKKLKNGSVCTQSESSPSTKLANYLKTHTSELQQAK
jgi:hypothetical protein